MEAIIKNGLALRQLFTRAVQSTPAIIIFTYFVISAAMSAPYYFGLYFGEFNSKEFSSLFFLDIYSIFIFAILPLTVGRLILGKRPAEFGLRLPSQPKKTVWLLLFSLLLAAPVIIYCTYFSQFTRFYSYGKISLTYFIFIQLVMFTPYYLAEEIFFRGFLFLSLWRIVGWHSYWISDLFFTMAHIGKPPLEILLSIPASILLNYLTQQSRSIYPAFIVHLIVGILLFSIINFHDIT